MLRDQNDEFRKFYTAIQLILLNPTPVHNRQLRKNGGPGVICPSYSVCHDSLRY